MTAAAAPAISAAAAIHLVPTSNHVPDPRALTLRLAQAIAEVLAGARSAGQLAPVTSLDVRRLLERSFGRFGARPGAPPQRPIVASVRASHPSDGAVEVCAVITIGARRRAIAFRLDAVNNDWCCTALRIG